jgi:hypothetical protein
MVKNTLSHILICMLDEINKKMILVLFSNKKNLSLPPKMKCLNLKGNIIPL